MIRISKLTDYAVVVMAEMARNHGTLLSAASLAERTGVPEPTVSKVLKILSKSGLIASTRGVSGGYILETDASGIAVTDIITAMEGPISLTACVSGSEDSCALESMCGVRGRWSPVNDAIKNALSPITLADMLNKKLSEKRV